MLKCLNSYVTHVGFISQPLSWVMIWNCTDSSPWSFNRGGRWGKKMWKQSECLYAVQKGKQ